MKSRILLSTLITLIILTLVGCGVVLPLNQSPTASFTANPNSGEAPLEVFFDASGSYDPDGNIVSYEWEFKDGNTGSGKILNHTFSSIGNYNVELTVTDNEGATDLTTKPITVTELLNQSPVASFTASPISGVAPLKVSFNALNSYDSDGTIINYAWDFKDGNTGSGETISHTFNFTGNYKVKLTVTDDKGATDSITKTITVTEPITPPVIPEPVPLGTPLTKDGITVTMQTIEVVGPPLCVLPFGVETYFSVINNSERVLKSGSLGPATGSLFYVLDEEIYEDEFNAIGYNHIGDAISWVYPGQSRSVGYRKCFHSPVTIKQITWTGTFADDQTEIVLGPWKNQYSN